MSYIKHYQEPGADEGLFGRFVEDIRIRPQALKRSNSYIAGLRGETKHFKDGTVWSYLFHILTSKSGRV